MHQTKAKKKKEKNRPEARIKFEIDDLKKAFKKLEEASLNPKWPRGRHDKSEEYTTNYSQIHLELNIFLCPECWKETPKQRRQTYPYRVVDPSIQWFKCSRGHETVTPITRPPVEVLVSKRMTQIFFSWSADRNLGDMDLWDSLWSLEKIFPGISFGFDFVKPISAEALLLRRNVVNQGYRIRLLLEERDKTNTLIMDLISGLGHSDVVRGFLDSYVALQKSTNEKLEKPLFTNYS